MQGILTESMTVAQYFGCSHSGLAEKKKKTKTRELKVIGVLDGDFAMSQKSDLL